MRPCFHIEITTPKKFVLNGLWFGPKRPKKVIVWVHGLGSSMFSKLKITDLLADKSTAVLVFNNRGHDKISRIARINEKRIGKTKLGGGGMEVFSDCVDDIQGAINFTRRQGAKKIYLAGHSTGCQKSVYWAYKRSGGRGVKGIILLAPMSDYSTVNRTHGSVMVKRATQCARALVRRGKPHELLLQSVWPLLDDAQRFLSLYTPDSVEEIFSYALPKKNPRIFKSVRVPTLVILAAKDEYGDRPAKEIAEWFDANIRAPHRVVVVPLVKHAFKGGEKQIVGEIRGFVKKY